MSTNTYILAIESSCDDTAAAVLKNATVLSNIVSSQGIHSRFGGVVPELASRAHQKNIIPVVNEALEKAHIGLDELSAVAFTEGPGLIGSLLVGSSFAKSLALSLGIPLIAVHHMQAHILAHFIADGDMEQPKFPFLALTISGGHTQIVLVNGFFEMDVLGETLDDAVGEAFDKSSKLLGLGYPGGVLIDKLAQTGDPLRFQFPKPNVSGLNFSFSGLKTAILYFIQKETQKDSHFVEKHINDICASIQHTIITILIEKLKKASKQTGITEIALGGGVSANSELRRTLKSQEAELGWKTYIPKLQYTTDNAAMIGIVGYLKYKRKLFSDMHAVASARIHI